MTPLKRLTVNDLAATVGGRVVGDGSRVIGAVCPIDVAKEGDITFVGNPAYRRFLDTTAADCVIVRAEDEANVRSPAAIVVDDPYKTFVHVMRIFHPAQSMPVGLRAATATIHPTATVDVSASVGPGCVVGAGCFVGPNVQLVANVVLGQNVTIDGGSILFPNVVLLDDVTVGKRCILHAGAVIGSDGFGYVENADGSFDKIPQVGTVVLGDDVEIGANTTVDRAAVGATIIGNGVKIDNLVHLAHGVRVGEHTAIAAQTGVSGSTSIGKRNRLAGQVGVVGHITLADDVVVYAQSGVGKDVPKPGVYFGSPIKDRSTAMRIEAALRRLPQLVEEVRQLQNIINERNASENE